MARKKLTATDDENLLAASKSRNKVVVIDDDEYSIGTELLEEPQEEKVVITGKKKGKKGKKKSSQRNDVGVLKEEEDEISSDGKKKPKGKKGGANTVFVSLNFELLEEADKDDESVVTGNKDSEEEDAPVLSFTGKKKASEKGGNKSGGLFTASMFDAIDDGVDNEGEVIDYDDSVEKSKDDDDEGDMVNVAFTGKNSKKGGKKGGGSAFFASPFDGLDDEDLDEDENKDEEEDNLAAITFSGKKKQSSKTSKKSDNSFSAALLDEENDDEASVFESTKVEDEDPIGIACSGKQKCCNKRRSSSAFASLGDEDGDGSEVVDPIEPEQPTVVAETLKNEEEDKEKKQRKRKKKKSGGTSQAEDDLNKILAELGENTSMAKPTPTAQEEKAQVQPPEAVAPADAVEKEGEEEKEESAAAKKRRKKKEKEKEKKASAAGEEKREMKTDTAEPKNADGKKKRPGRKLLEELVRRKEAGEREKREEEERIRKEEEEQKRLEDLERQAEEARRRKKEKEKEKLLRKKQEGKPLTGKEKEEARWLEARRKQILDNAVIPPLSGDKESAPTNRPKYWTKKSKPAHHQANGAASGKMEESVNATVKEQLQQETVAELESEETDKVGDAESQIGVEEPEIDEAPKENLTEEDDDEEWDAKSWDDVNLNVKGAFDDEENESKPESPAKKEIKTAVPADSAKLSVAAKKSLEAENKQNQPEVEVLDKTRKKVPAAKDKALNADAAPKQVEENLRSPICCIMGHVNTGKTKLLDCIQSTNIQEHEAGGITQQIGATYFPVESIRGITKELKADAKLEVPGLLVIDTPGHESFNNLRSRGSGLCDIAILVVDFMHGLEPQTIECLNLLKMRNTEFIVALNKVDRLYGWKTCRNAPFVTAFKQQSDNVKREFHWRLSEIITQFKEQGLNTEFYKKNKEMGETFSIVPTSAISGEGIPELLLLLVQRAQKTMVEKLTFSNEVQCTVLEVKITEGHGPTIDVVLVNGVLHEGDQIVVCGLQGPIVTSIRAMKELGVKGTYHKEIKAAQGINIAAKGLEHAIAGTGLFVVGPDDDLEDVKESAMEGIKSVMRMIDKNGEGVYVQASSLGSLEALLEFLKSPEVKIPVSGIGIGPVSRKDVMKAGAMLEKKKEYAILAFDVKLTRGAQDLADKLGVKIFIADVIYHLFDQFKAYIDNLKEEKKREAADEAVFPCVLKIIPQDIRNRKDPIVLGVEVLEGIARVGTPICIPQKNFIDIGRIASIHNNNKPVDTAKKGQSVTVKIVGSNSEEQQKMFGRHFNVDDGLVSRISRRSIDVLKANYRDDLSSDEWNLVVHLKNVFKIR